MSLWELLGVERVDEGRWRVAVARDWWGFGGPHGGVLAALAAGLAREAAGPDSTVRALDARYLNAADTRPIEFAAVSRRGGRVRMVDVHATQAGACVLTAAVTLSGAARTADGSDLQVPAFDLQVPVMPAVPPAAECARFRVPREISPVAAHLEIRPAAGSLPLTGRTGADAAWMCAWLRLVPDRPVDEAVAAVFCDALPPGVFPLLTVPVRMPTVQLAVHFHADLRAEPVTGPVLAVQRNVTTGGGWSADDGELWSADGRLLAQVRQLRRILGRLTLPSPGARANP